MIMHAQERAYAGIMIIIIIIIQQGRLKGELNLLYLPKMWLQM